MNSEKAYLYLGKSKSVSIRVNFKILFYPICLSLGAVRMASHYIGVANFEKMEMTKIGLTACFSLKLFGPTGLEKKALSRASLEFLDFETKLQLI